MKRHTHTQFLYHLHEKLLQFQHESVSWKCPCFRLHCIHMRVCATRQLSCHEPAGEGIVSGGLSKQNQIQKPKDASQQCITRRHHRVHRHMPVTNSSRRGAGHPRVSDESAECTHDGCSQFTEVNMSCSGSYKCCMQQCIRCYENVWVCMLMIWINSHIWMQCGGKQ
jgi:hypothetical protein